MTTLLEEVAEERTEEVVEDVVELAPGNLDPETVDGFGEEWSTYDQSRLGDRELNHQFDAYFQRFPWDRLPADAEGFDLGCGSGRWAKLVAPRVGHLHCIDPSPKALETARRNLAAHDGCTFHEAGVDTIPLADDSMDFGYSLGVLHHIPDTAAGLRSCVAKLKKGAPFALYIYYAFDNRPAWFQALWKVTDPVRRAVAKMPFWMRRCVTEPIAVVVYYPLARLALLLEKLGLDVDVIPLSGYRHRAFYSMRTDALDRFGTKLEQRFTAKQIQEMMEDAGLEEIEFGDSCPYWCAVGIRR